jgi:predicted ATPase
MLRIVLTGGPGAGKSTVLEALRAQGYVIVDDMARALIRERKAKGLSPRPPPREFAEQILRADMENYDRVAGEPGCVFFERGVIDALGGMQQFEPLDDEALRARAARYRYDDPVFVLPPWQAIYTTDAERDHTFEHAVYVDGLIRHWYARRGFRIVDVPPAPVEERCAFVLRRLGLAPAAS